MSICKVNRKSYLHVNILTYNELFYQNFENKIKMYTMLKEVKSAYRMYFNQIKSAVFIINYVSKQSVYVH